MKSTTLALAMLASLSFGSVALAQGHDRHGSNDEWPQNQQHMPYQTNQRDFQRGGDWGHQRANRRHDQHSDRSDRYDSQFDQRNERWNDRRAEYNARSPEFRRGGYIPHEYRNPSYVVTDYRAHRLPPPPRHQEWVQVGSDYVLIAIATGIIASIVLSH